MELVEYILYKIQSLRRREFKGRFFTGKVARLLLFSLPFVVFNLSYRIRGLFRTQEIKYLLHPKFKLVKDYLNLRNPHPMILKLSRRLITDSSTKEGRAREIFEFLKRYKARRPAQNWLFPLEALWLPSLDCKGFAVLLKDMFRAANIDASLWIGLPTDGRDGHAWVETELEIGKMIFDQRYQESISPNDYCHRHPFVLSVRIA